VEEIPSRPAIAAAQRPALATTPATVPAHDGHSQESRAPASGIGGFITKPAEAVPVAPPSMPEPRDEVLIFAGEASREMAGVIRDERGVRLAPEVDD
jgi:hypothetical protein